MHDVVVDALGRIDAAEEAAAFDAVKPKTGYGRGTRARPWQLESQTLGTTIRQEDIPRLMTDELAKAAIVPGGIKTITKACNLASPKALMDYAASTYKMPYAVGLKFVRYLEERAKKSGAAPAATGTTPESKAATSEAPAPIVPQPAQDDKTTDLQARIAELEAQNAELRKAFEEVSKSADQKRAENDQLSAKLMSIQGREMTELEDEVETLRRRVAHYEADDAACGPARVEELEDRLSRANDEHVRDLELIRDLTRRLVTCGAC